MGSGPSSNVRARTWRLAALHAGDGFLPRQLTYRGTRLVYSWGIGVLAAVSSLLVIAFGASVSALIPLYAIGVFLSFTMSQAGMIVRWRRIGRLRQSDAVITKGPMLHFDPGWRRKLTVNAFGALLTGTVVAVLALTKFRQGAWIVVLLIPTLVWAFFQIHGHYQAMRARLSVERISQPPAPVSVIHLLLISDVHAAALRQVQFARSMGLRWIALHVEIDPDRTADVRRKWRRFFPADPLVVLPSPLRDLIGPVRDYVERLRAGHPTAFIHIITAQILMDSLLAQALHQNTAVVLKLALQHVPMVVVSDVAYPLGN